MPPTITLNPLISSPSIDLDRRRQRQVLRFGVGAMLGATGNDDVELPRQVREVLLLRKLSVNSRAIGEASNSSWRVSPATGQPTTFRMLSMPVWSETSPTAASRVKSRASCSISIAAQLNLLPRRDIHESDAKLARDLRQHSELRGVRQAVGDPHAHHEAARRLTAEEHARPLQALAIPFVDRLPAFLRETRDLVHDVESILLALIRSILLCVTTTRPLGRQEAAGSSTGRARHPPAPPAAPVPGTPDRRSPATSGLHEPHPVHARVASLTPRTLRAPAAPLR